jgi:NAD+ kinase
VKIGLFANSKKKGVSAFIDEIENALKRKQHRLMLDSNTAQALGKSGLGYEDEKIAEIADLVIAVGGDGTLLHAARALAGKATPILGVNLGGLGFLTEIKREEFFSALESILRNDFEVEDRMMVKAEVLRRGKVRESFIALNDIVISMGAVARAITLEIHINGEFLGRYIADGVIVATPTGSTAYSLSGGGPIVKPGVEAMILTPICPHSLSIRPIVIPSSEIIDIAASNHKGILLTIDGQHSKLLIPQEVVRVSRAVERVRLIKSGERNFYELVRTKLGWGGIEI